MTALISVVIPCYNQAQFLPDAIASVLHQTWPNVELIVVDDGSTDDTSRIAAQFASVRCLRQSNKGLAAARNAGLGCSTGQYIAFLDADDRLLPEALEHGAQCLVNNPDYAFVHGDYRRIAEDGSPANANMVDKPAPGRTGYLGLLENNYIAMHGTVLYRRDILESIRGFDSSLPACEDYELYLRIARQYSFGYHPHLVAEVREHSRKMSRDFSLMLRTSLRVLQSQKPFLNGNKQFEQAFDNGTAFWRECYGERGVASVYFRLRTEGLQRSTLRDMMALFYHYPRAPLSFVGLLCERLASKMSGADRASILGRWARKRDLGKLLPRSRDFGFERGTPVDRYYIEDFLAHHAQDIRGRVLEVADNSYTLKFGENRVTQNDVLNLTEHPGASIVADLTRAENIPSDTFDCIILTQTLHVLYDVPAALRTVHRILKPGGVVLLTVPGISPICTDPGGHWADFWRFTDASLTRLLQEVFPCELVRVEVYGNVLSASAFLYGLVVADLSKNELDHRDPQYQVIVAARASKPNV